jgi:hypothetical protein
MMCLRRKIRRWNRQRMMMAEKVNVQQHFCQLRKESALQGNNS